MSNNDDEFERLADAAAPSALGEVWRYLRATRKWWLAPVIATLLVLATLVAVSVSGVGPFIYALF